MTEPSWISLTGLAQALEGTVAILAGAVDACASGVVIFGDDCSPVRDTTIISSMAEATDHIDHVRTQLPYALARGGITAVAFGILGASL
jgi:Na+/H+ antiporter NhaC